ncbi:MAG: DEAD/DEAH box helicase family protein, partial [Gammaproteobacteria bacterium]|nr:DEAD/DEAH box helicase family protein [Gammaproteobacteria bacterium]
MGLTNFVKGLFHQEEVASTSQLQLQADSGGLALTLPSPVYLLAKQGGGDELSMHQFLRMQILLEQGLARETENGICLEAEEAVSLDEDTRYILNLPAPWPGSFKLAVTGLSTRPDFILRLHLLAIDGELIRQYRLDGPLLYLSAAETYLPDPLQWQALSAIARHSALPGRDEYANLSAVHQLAQAADAGLRIDRAVFQSFQTLSPEKVGLTVEVQTDGSLELAPSFGSELNQESVAARLGQLDPRGEAQSLRVGKTLVLLDEQRLRAAHEIIRKRHIPARLRRKFFAAPGSFLDAALVDLDSGFSMRVKGVGPFQHAYFGETDSSDIEWFEQGENAEPELEPAGPADEFPGGLMEPQDLPGIITGPEILEDFKVKLEDAHTTNANVVKLDDCYVNIADRPRVRDAVTQLDEVFKNPPAEKAGPIAVDIHLNDTTADFGTEIQAPDKRIQADVEIDFSQYSRQPFPHQIEAVRWLLALACDKTKETKDRKITGALLADDMGLGKTYTTIVGMREILLQAETRKPVLIVAPLSLLENWKREINDTYKEPFFGRIVILQADGDLPKFRITGMSVETFSRMPRHKEAEAKPSEPPAQAGAEEDIGETEKISFKKPSSAPLPWEESEKISPQEDFLKKGIEEQVNLDSRVRGNDDTEASQVNLDSRVRGNDGTEAAQVNLDSRVRGNDGTEASQVDLDSRVRG